MNTWRKVACCLATVAGVLFTASADIYRATADGAGTKDGSSWENATAWADALASCAALEGENEIWLAGDVTVSALSTVTVKGDLTVRGGFTGTETSSAERPANAISTISGNNAVNIIQPTVDADKTLAFERVALVRGSYRAVKKAGAGNISFTDCELSGNGRTIGHNKGDVEGLGLYASGGGSATLTRCKLEGNGPTDYIQEGPGGFAIRASGLSRLTIDDCVFLTNGLWKASKTDGDLRAHRGIAIYLTNTPLTMRNSRVSGSIAEPKNTSELPKVGGIVSLVGNCGDSAFTNCVFSGNLDLNKGGTYTRTGGGIVDIDLGSTGQKVDICGCTFAYNISQSTDAGCLAVRKGDVHVTDSTFFYNLLGYSNAGGYGADITVFADGKLAIEKSRLDTLTAGSISSVNPENLTIDTATMTTGNPHFKSSVLDYEAIVSFGSGCAVAKTSYDKLVDIDATLSPAPVKPDIGEGNVLYVDQSATGAKDGSSWADAFADLGSALAAASSVKNEIWVKGDLKPAADAVWTEINDSVTVRGGFAGTESAATDRAAGAVTTMDGNNNYDFIKVSVVGACTLTFENFVFTKAKYRAIFKRGFGDLVCRNCKFLNCGTNQNADGRGILAQGGSCAAKLVVEACEFAGLKRSGRQPSSGCGTAVNVALHDRFICDNSLFCSNGVPILNSGNDNRGVLGSALLIRGTPVTMRNTRIAANGGSSRESDATGGIVYISGYADGSACTNCAFVGNYANNFKDGKNNNSCGAFVYSPCAASHRLDFESCTFAYNMSQGNYSPGGLNVLNGTVKVHNSIFWHNIHGYKAQSGYGADIDVKAGAVTVSHSLVTGKTIEFCRGASDGNLVLDDTVVTVDPSFVSSYEDYASHLNFTSSADYVNPGTGFTFAYLGSLDAHLLSVAGYWLNDGTVGPATNVTSLAIDGGDPDSPYGEEPMPNGGHINLGAYGNTEFASKTPSGQPSVESFEITYPDGYSRPQTELTLGLESGTSYKATVTFTCKTGDVVVATGTFEGCQSGNVVTWKLPYYFQPGTPLVIEYAVSAPGATTKAGSGDSTASGALPPFYGKGGGANVIHVREGADCLMNGTDWTDAYPDVPAALQDIGPGKTEIWIARETTFASGTFTLEAPLAIRGGFAGTETSLAERTGMSQTVFDLQDASAGFQFTAGADCPLLFDRVVISRAFDRAITKSGAGSLTLVDCRISNNGHLNVVDGRGIYASGCPVAATNCVFDGNYYGSDGDVTGQGGGAYLTSCPQAIFESCLFTTNGNQYVHPKTTQCGGGGALYAYATRLICRNTRFAANVTGDRSQYAVIRMENNCDGSLFENCAIVGNSLISHWNDNDFNSSSILMVNMNVSSYRLTIRNCTFAYNFNSNRTTPGALNVVRGTVDVADSIFWGNYRGSRIKDDTAYPSAEDIAVEANGYLTLSNVFLKSMDMATDKRHCLQVADLTHLVTNNIVTGDAMLVSTPEDAAALMVKGNDKGNRYLDWYYPKSAISALCALNVHLRGGSGYHDENDNGALVRTYSRGKVGGSSPAIDAGPKMMKGLLEPKPNGNRVNLGAYGNTPWATMSDNTGLLLFVR